MAAALTTIPDRLWGRGLDALVVGLAAWSVAEVWIEPLPPRLVMTLACVLICVPLLWRRRAPLLAPAVALASVALVSLASPTAIGSEMQIFAAGALVFWVIGSENDRARALAGLLAGLAVVFFTVSHDPTTHLDDFAFAGFMFAGLWLAGRAFGRTASEAAGHARRAEVLELERELAAREAVALERARIARELHDVIAHHVSVMVVQSGAADEILDRDPQAAREALRAIRAAGKGALGELRQLLGLLRADQEEPPVTPLPGLDQLEELFDQVRSTGLDVQFRVEGAAYPLPATAAVTAYRIIQEALTNTLKHAGLARATVTMAYGVDELGITVVDDGPPGDGTGTAVPAQPRPAAEHGHGLIGMRERVALLGGHVTAAALPSGGFRVQARLPRVVGA